MKINSRSYSSILILRNLPSNPAPTPRQLADWIWSSIGLALQEWDIEILPPQNGIVNAYVRVHRRSLADFLDRAVADLSFNGRRVCVRPKLEERNRPVTPNEGREREE